MDKKLARLLLSMHKLYNRRFQHDHSFKVKADADLESDRIEDELHSIINNGYSNEKETLLLMVEQREFEKRCLNVNLCPKCGKDLSVGIGQADADVIKVCKHCNLSFPHIQ